VQTKPGDVVTIYHRGKAVGYARVEAITADVKPGWWQLVLTILTLPPTKVTWILRESYIDGEQFTMGGEPMRIERLPEPEALAPQPSGSELEQECRSSEGAKVIDLTQRLKQGRSGNGPRQG